MKQRIAIAIIAFALALGIAGPGRAMAEDGSASAFVERLAAQVLGAVGNPNLDSAERIAVLQNLLERDFDLTLLGRFALGSHWDAATPAQRREYLDAFIPYVLATYAVLLDEFDGESFAIVDEEPSGAQAFVVTARIERIEGAALETAWRVRRVGSGYQVIDVIFEGMSVALTQRSQFASVVRRDGLDGLIQALRDRAGQRSASASS